MGRFDDLIDEGSRGEQRTMRVVRAMNKKFDRAPKGPAGRPERRSAVATSSSATDKLHARRSHRAPAGARGWYTTRHEGEGERVSFDSLGGLDVATVDEAKRSHRGAVGWTKEKEAKGRELLKDYYSQSVGAGPVGHLKPDEKMVFGKVRKVGKTKLSQAIKKANDKNAPPGGWSAADKVESRFDLAAGLVEDHDPADGVKLRGLLETLVKDVGLCKEAAAKGDAADCAKRCAGLDATLTQMTEIANRL